VCGASFTLTWCPCAGYCSHVDRSPRTPLLRRTCPWCASARVIAFGEEGLVRALARHLETCTGEDAGDDE
jgi:hypothetical protein